MKAEMTRKDHVQMKKSYVYAGIVLIFILFLGLIIITNSIEDKELKDYFYVEGRLIEIDTDYSSVAKQYYDQANEHYIYEEFERGIEDCEKAREYYSLEGQEYRVLRAEVKKFKKTELSELSNLYVNLLNEAVEISNNMYEACEYFESAMTYYNIYFNMQVQYDDQSFDMADSYMDSMGDKIGLHDEAVERYNTFLSEIIVEIGR